jgi:hypothetical protein
MYWKRGSTFSRRLPAVGPPSAIDFGLVYTDLLDDPGSGDKEFMRHACKQLFGAI